MPNIEIETLRAEIEVGIDALERGEFIEVEGADLDAYLELLTGGVPNHGRLPLDDSPSEGDT